MKPAAIVDKIIEIALDLVVPGRGAGETNWYVTFILMHLVVLEGPFGYCKSLESTCIQPFSLNLVFLFLYYQVATWLETTRTNSGTYKS